MVDTQKFDDIYKQLLTDIKNIFPFTNNVIEEYEDPNYLLMFINNSINANISFFAHDKIIPIKKIMCL